MTTTLTRILLAALALLVAAVSFTTEARALTPEQTQPEGVVALMTRPLNRFWASQVADYTGPDRVRWYGRATRTDCGVLPAGNSVFCPGPHGRQIYLDPSWHRELVAEYGDYASGFVYAHEWAHHVQYVRTHLQWAQSQGFYAGSELQADCYAGVFTASAVEDGLVVGADVEEARRWLRENGDPAGTSLREPDAHGSGTLRMRYFDYGLSTQSVAGCDRVYLKLYRGAGGSGSFAPPARPSKRLAHRRIRIHIEHR
ncbi:MAG: neutral zinc metallopeptidase [Gaiellaceae bacterium]